jgi:hypothetical protein
MNLKFLHRFGLVALLTTPLLALAKELPFSGNWSAIETIDGQSKPCSTFTISLSEDGSENVRGTYCFITRNGNRIDCSPDNEVNINGHAEHGKNTATVNFNSFFGATGGMAKITLNDDWLIWDVAEPPKGGDYYGPMHIAMHKDTSAESHTGERLVVSNKAFLYDTPSRSQATHVYLIKGDYVKPLSVSPDLQFWKIEFTSKKNGRHIVKWVNCVDINFCTQ